MTRSSISKKLRFEVFKRDSFTCQYCGRKAPDVLLEIDHIEPVAKDGTNDILNLLTSCKDCNSGKSDRRLGEHTVLEKQRQQLAELQDRKEQIEMMFEWQKGLLQLQDDVVERLSAYWSEQVPGYILNENGLQSLKRLNKKFQLDELLNAIHTAARQYLVFVDGKPTQESVDLAWSKVGGICRVRQMEQDNPDAQRLYYIRGILRKRIDHLNEGQAMGLLKRALELNATVESLEESAKAARSWTQWRNGIQEFINEQVAEKNKSTDNSGSESAP